MSGYRAGEIEDHPSGGWTIEILDQDGDVIEHLYQPGHEAGTKFGPHIEEALKNRAEGLLSHLNR